MFLSAVKAMATVLWLWHIILDCNNMAAKNHDFAGSTKDLNLKLDNN